LSALDELQDLLSGGARAIVIARSDADLRSQSGDNELFVLKVGEGSSAAGGRGGGFGERRVVGVAAFEKKKGSWSKCYEAPNEDVAIGFEVPYYVSRIPITLSDGTETMGYGVVEPELVDSMAKKAGVSFSP
jgi:hypothetical protein